MLRWQLSPTQMKWTCNANSSIYITFRFFFILVNLEFYLQIMKKNLKIWSSYIVICKKKKKKKKKKEREVIPTQIPLRFVTQRNPKNA